MLITRIHDNRRESKRAGVGAVLSPEFNNEADTRAAEIKNSLTGIDEEDFNYPIIHLLSMVI